MVELVDNDVRVMVLPQVVSVGVCVSLVMVEVDADNRNAIAIEPFDKWFEILDPCVWLYGGTALAYGGAAGSCLLLTCLSVGGLYGLALHGASRLLLHKRLHVLKQLRQRLGIGRVAPALIEVAVLVLEICVPELPGNPLAVGSVAAVVRLGSAYVAGLELNSGFHRL